MHGSLDELLQGLANTRIVTLDGEGSEPDFFLIGEIAQRVSLEPKTIRFYERAGLLLPKRQGRFRVYGRKDLLRLEHIKQFRALGMSLRSIRELLKTLELNASKEALIPDIRKIFSRQLKELEEKLQSVERGIEQISRLLK